MTIAIEEQIWCGKMECFNTKRVTVPAMEELLDKRINVLDHGFIRVIDYMGADSSVVQAARVSYGIGTKHLSQDVALINYLISHSHTTPFEMCEIKLHVRLPIFVARQWVRHRTANINEYSARYSILNEDCYIPEADQIAKQSITNAQGRDEPFVREDALNMIAEFQSNANNAFATYSKCLDLGVSRELARMNLTLAHYTEWYWKIDLHNLLNFLKLRASGHAQYEIRVYAEAILSVVKEWVPLTYDAFVRHVLKAKTISEDMQVVLRRMIRGEDVKFEDSGMTKREWKSLLSMLEEK